MTDLQQTYQLVTLRVPAGMQDCLPALRELALECQCDGIEEFSLAEITVDEMLGERSYSGGDLPLEVLLEVEGKVQGSGDGLDLKVYFCQEGSEKLASTFMQKLAGPFPGVLAIHEEKVQEDWNSQWKEHFSPIEVSPYLEVVPSWEKGRYLSSSQFPIYIYPGMAFGTGGHETTYLCLKLLNDQVPRREGQPFGHCLDFGCGSGILGIAAAKWGYHTVDFVDIEEEALKNSHENILLNFEDEELNGTDARLSFRLALAAEKKGPQFDLIFANILESTLIASRDLLLDSLLPGGRLILSGLLNDQLAHVQSWYTNYTKARLVPLEQTQKGDWSALLLLKEGPSH